MTFEAWSGSEETLAEFVEAALKENGIPVRREQREVSLAIYVPPSRETVAKEIVREIIEGAPLE